MWKSLFVCLLLGCVVRAQPVVVATGLRTPHRLLLTPRGNFLVTEPSTEPNAGRISFVNRNGQARPLVDGLPSGTEVVGGGSGPSGMALRDRTLYVSIGAGDTERQGQQPTRVFNPAGVSSPLHSSILELRFGADVDTILGTFVLTRAQHDILAGGNEVELSDGAGSAVRISLLANLPDAEPDAVTLYRFSNPWSLALSEDGATLYVTDASADTLLRIPTATGRIQRIVRFPKVRNPTPIGPPVVDSVPTGVRVQANRVLVSFLTGFPFAAFQASVVSVDPATGATDLYIHGLTSVTDVLWRTRPNGQLQVFALEFSTNQTAQPPGPGRLIRYDSPLGQVAIADLRAPVSLAFDASTSDLFILELTGRLLRLRVE